MRAATGQPGIAPPGRPNYLPDPPKGEVGGGVLEGERVDVVKTLLVYQLRYAIFFLSLTV